MQSGASQLALVVGAEAAIARQPFAWEGEREISFRDFEFVDTYQALDPRIVRQGDWKAEEERHQAPEERPAAGTQDEEAADEDGETAPAPAQRKTPPEAAGESDRAVCFAAGGGSEAAGADERPREGCCVVM